MSEFIINDYNGDYKELILIKHSNKGRKRKRRNRRKLKALEIALGNSKVDYRKEAVARSKRRIRELILSNNFTYFFTLTFDLEKIDRYDLETIDKEVQKAFKHLRRKHKGFRYLYLYEEHIDKAYHIHRSY